MLISHAWGGRDEFVEKKAHRLSYHGFAAFALDMYGKGKRGKNQEGVSGIDGAVRAGPRLPREAHQQRAELREVTAASGRTTRSGQWVIASAACACSISRAAERTCGRRGASTACSSRMVSRQRRHIPAKILMLHGYDDPMAPPEDVLAIGKEFTQAGADWQIHAYGGTMHAFTNPAANTPAGGMQYSEKAARRSWHALTQHLDEVLR